MCHEDADDVVDVVREVGEKGEGVRAPWVQDGADIICVVYVADETCLVVSIP